MSRLARRRAPLLAAAVALCAVAATACDKISLLAPSGSSITLFSINSALPLNGSTELVATVIEQGVAAPPQNGNGQQTGTTGSGTPVHNGTVVTFTTTLGDINPREARTENGKVTVRFTAGGQSGTARIIAFSGGARSNELTVAIGAAGAGRVVLSANPATLPAGGGSTQIVALVTDSSGSPLAGVPVAFSASAGSLSPTVSTTDDTGEARTQLTTTRETTVTATAGGSAGTGGMGATAPVTSTITVRVNAAVGISLSTTTTNPTAGQPVIFSVTVTSTPDSAGVQNVTIDFGDGTSQSLGMVTGTQSVTHVYRTTGIFVVTASVTDRTGLVTTVRTTVSVAPAAPPIVTLTASNPTPRVQDVVTFTATATLPPGAAPIQRFEWDFGDGTPVQVTTGGVITHIFGTVGRKIVRVRVVTIDGQVGVGQTEVNVLAPLP